MSKNTHILVVDDQSDIRHALVDHLHRNGFDATPAPNAAIAREILAEQSVDLVVLDIMMPGEDGLSLCRHLSETTHVPVILLTALVEDIDRIVGLEIGADDYVTKPFNPRELVARIRAILRRGRDKTTQKQSLDLNFGEWRLDPDQGELHNINKIVTPLSTGELSLLMVFLENPSKVLSRDELLNLTKGRAAFPYERSIDNMISRLRRKIEIDPAAPHFIKTVWGGGYRFVRDIESS